MPLTDKDIAQDLLNAQKMSMQTFNTLAYESSNESLKRDVLSILQEEHLMHSQVFNYMNQRGWYEPRPADRNDVQILASKLANAVNVSNVGVGTQQWPGNINPGSFAYGGGIGTQGGGGYIGASPAGGYGGWPSTGFAGGYGGGVTSQVPNPMSISLPDTDQVRAQNVNFGGQLPFNQGFGTSVNWATAPGATGTGAGNYGQQGRLSEGIMRV